MRLLLDTHAFLWWARGDSRLSPRSRGAIRSSRNDVYFSVASGWEIIVKEGRGRLDLPEPARTLIPRLLSQNEFVVLPVHLTHALKLIDLPGFHRDPFDRILVAQALEEGLSLVTADEQIRRYPVRTLW